MKRRITDITHVVSQIKDQKMSGQINKPAGSSATSSPLNSNEIKEFRDLVEKLADTKSPEIFRNSSPDKANIVIANIYRTSSTVKVYVDNLDGSTSDKQPDYLQQLEFFLKKKDTHLQVVVEENLPESKKYSNVLNVLRQFKDNNNIEIRKATPTFVELVNKISEGEKIHFAIGDNEKFRIQYDLEKKRALFSFNNAKVTQKLKNIFENSWDKCEQLAL